MPNTGGAMKFLTAAACILTLCSTQGSGGIRTTGPLDNVLREAARDEKIAVWVFFTDKGEAGAAVPANCLSPRALQRRARVLPADKLVDESDLPVRAEYLARVTPLVTGIRQTSRWLNGVSVDATPAEIASLQALPFVREIDLVLKYRRGSGTETSRPSGE